MKILPLKGTFSEPGTGIPELAVMMVEIVGI
jgi:hypothetical protein